MYQVQISAFEGPLDLLLQLISKAKIDIKDIFVSEITEQYLSVISAMEQVDLDAASEFLSMAATLLYIKSRSLLPKQVVEPDVEEEKQRLIQNLYEYRRLKEAAETMAALESGALEHYYKLPDEYMYTENEVVLEGLRVEDLYAGFLEILKERDLRQQAPKPMALAQHRAMPVVQKVGEIRQRLRREGSLLFTELFPPEAEKDEIIASFLALLELISAGEVHAAQKGNFGEIVIGLNKREKGKSA
jgi:segregation and condensation protein A